MKRSARLRYLRAAFEEMGRVRRPVPSYTVLTDRTLGTKWALTHDALATVVQIEAFNSKTHSQRTEYGAYEEPRAEANPNYRLVLDSGSLSMLLDPLPTGVGSKDQAPILTRRGYERTSLQIDVDSSGSITTSTITY